VGKIWRAIREIYDLEKVMATKRLFGNGYRIKEEWLKWSSAFGLLCHCRIPMKLK